MNWHFKIAGIFLLGLLTSCNLIPLESQPTDDVIVPTLAATTPVYPSPEIPIDVSVTPIPATITATLSPGESTTPVVPGQSPTPTPTKKLDLKPTATQSLLDVQIGSPIGIPNFAHPELGCQWMGVAGQVFDNDGTPIEELVIEIGGSLAEEDVFGLTISGQAEAYGLGGYEFKLSDQPISSSGTVWARVHDFDGNSLSDETYFSTYAECDQNLIILNFVQTYAPPTDWVYLPLIFNNK